MREWLVIQLVAPLASFGELAGNVRRGGRERPGKAALLGLIGAALGVRRDDSAGQSALADGYDVAIRSWRDGEIMQDYHTIQSLPRGRKARTRADALARRGELVTSITLREYRCDVLHEAAFAPRDGARWTAGQIAEALRRPVFALWLGRKSCPLGAPLAPRVVTAVSPESAFISAEGFLDDGWAASLGVGADERPMRLAVEANERASLDDRNVAAVRRRDVAVDRVTWRFTEREELVYAPVTGFGGTG
jgi:CRISPR system Cascade subunit CasD